MSTQVTVSTTGQVSWPNRCARCGTKAGLTAAGASIGRVTSVRPTLGGEVAFTGELTSLSYPVCQEHAKGLGWASAVTRKTAGLAALRVLVVFVGVLGLALVPTVIRRTIEPPTSDNAGMPLELGAIFVLAALATIALVFAYLKLPLRLVKRTADAVTVKFKNDAYAQEFARLNKDIVERE
jgi:hypothetical protein